MNIQFSVVDPSLVTSEGVSIIAGIVEVDSAFADYDVMPIYLERKDEGQSTIVLTWRDRENLAKRNDYPEDILNGSFHSVLKQPVWRRVHSDSPAGEVALVKTDLAPATEGNQVYVMFGIVQGSYNALKALSGQIFENDRALDSGVVAYMGHFKGAGREVNHTIGNHLLNLLTKPLWGFGPEKQGIRTFVSIPQFKAFEENTRHIVEHGINMSSEFGGKPDQEYVHFLREMDKRGMLPSPMWETQAQRQVREAVASEITKQSVREERLGEMKALKRALDESPQP